MRYEYSSVGKTLILTY